jgi:hypothetical protein
MIIDKIRHIHIPHVMQHSWGIELLPSKVEFQAPNDKGEEF